MGRHPVDLNRLAYFILADAGEVAGTNAQETLRAAVATDQDDVVDLTYDIQGFLAAQPPLGPRDAGMVAGTPGPGREAFWLLEGSLTCVRPVEIADAGPDEDAPRGLLPNGEPILRLRATAEDLTVTGEDRLTAGSARVTLQRERTILDDGSRRRDTTLSIQGALGIALTEREGDSSYLYAAYQLERVRSQPAPTLPAGQTAADGDTNVLELGIIANRLFETRGSRMTFDVTGTAALILNRVDRSERLQFNMRMSPGFGPTQNLGLCGYGAFLTIVPGISGRCDAALRLQVNHFLDRGTAAPTANDEFVFGGGEFGIEFAQSNENGVTGDGVFAGATYRYEASLSGAVPDIDRFTAFLKYRHWFGTRFGVDFGLDFVDGINPESFADENRISVSFGLIF